MNESILLGRGAEISSIPRQTWQKHVDMAPQHVKSRLDFMSEAHHLVRYLVVRELPSQDRPIEPAFIAQALKLPLVQLNSILDELEKNLFFLFRDDRGAVVWAYPVTAEKTPHHLRFDSGETLYAA